MKSVFFDGLVVKCIRKIFVPFLKLVITKKTSEKSVFPENGGKPTWLFGANVTAADVALAIALFRLSNVGHAKDLWVGKLPKVERFFTFAKENMPGFKDVTKDGF